LTHPTAIYQVTLDGLGRRRRHNAGQSALGRHPECESAAAARVCDSYRTPPRAEDDIEFWNVPDVRPDLVGADEFSVVCESLRRTDPQSP
jgi:hypothetical protein